jgi:hypothetical protein
MPRAEARLWCRGESTAGPGPPSPKTTSHAVGSPSLRSVPTGCGACLHPAKAGCVRVGVPAGCYVGPLIGLLTFRLPRPYRTAARNVPSSLANPDLLPSVRPVSDARLRDPVPKRASGVGANQPRVQALRRRRPRCTRLVRPRFAACRPVMAHACVPPGLGARAGACRPAVTLALSSVCSPSGCHAPTERRRATHRVCSPIVTCCLRFAPSLTPDSMTPCRSARLV